jgi:hypothetical protein
MAAHNRNYELPKVKKCSRYYKEQLGLLWAVRVGTLVGTYLKKSQILPLKSHCIFSVLLIVVNNKGFFNDKF